MTIMPIIIEDWWRDKWRLHAVIFISILYNLLVMPTYSDDVWQSFVNTAPKPLKSRWYLIVKWNCLRNKFMLNHSVILFSLWCCRENRKPFYKNQKLNQNSKWNVVATNFLGWCKDYGLFWLKTITNVLVSGPILKRMN